MFSKAPSTRIQIFSKTVIFFLRLHLLSTRKKRFWPQIRRVFKTLSRLQISKNEDLSYLCGRSKANVFEYDDVNLGSSALGHNQHKHGKLFDFCGLMLITGRMRQKTAHAQYVKSIVLESFQRIRVDVQIRVKYVFENIRIRVEGA